MQVRRSLQALPWAVHKPASSSATNTLSLGFRLLTWESLLQAASVVTAADTLSASSRWILYQWLPPWRASLPWACNCLRRSTILSPRSTKQRERCRVSRTIFRFWLWFSMSWRESYEETRESTDGVWLEWSATSSTIAKTSSKASRNTLSQILRI